MPIYFKVTDDKGRILIPGIVTIGRFARWHPAEAARMPVTGRGDGSKDMSVFRSVDAASPQFMKYSISGETFSSVLHMVASDGSTYMTVNMDGIIITSYTITGGGGSDSAMENLTFNYRKISIAYSPTGPTSTSTTETVVQSFIDDLY